MKLKKLIQVKGIFVPFIRTKLPAKLSYKILKFIRAVEFEEKFLNDKLKEIIGEYGKKDENGKFVLDKDGNIVIQEDKVDACNKAVEELDELEVNAPEIKFDLAELDSLTLSVVDIAIIEDFINKEE